MEYVWLLSILDKDDYRVVDIKVFNKKEHTEESIKKLEQYNIPYVVERRKVRSGKNE